MPKKRKDGRYQRKITLSDGRQKIVYGRTLAELNAAADEMRSEDWQGMVVGDTTTVGEWAKIWITKYKGSLRPKTLEMYRGAYNVHILPVLGDMMLRSVRPVHCREVMHRISDQSESLQHKVIITMHQIFSTAQQNGLVLTDPSMGLKVTPHHRGEKRKALSDEQVKELLAANLPLKARIFVGLCLCCGLRREEALGLQWGDIDGARLTVNRALSFAGNRPDPSQELKTKAAHRTVPVPDQVRSLLMSARMTDLYVITKESGGPMTETAYVRMWDKVQKGVSFHVTAHMLRHTYCTQLYRAGIDLRTAQYLMGHSSIQMTAQVYTHLQAEDSMKAADKINDRFKDIV